jgi:hypothetical protein
MFAFKLAITCSIRLNYTLYFAIARLGVKPIMLSMLYVIDKSVRGSYIEEEHSKHTFLGVSSLAEVVLRKACFYSSTSLRYV